MRRALLLGAAVAATLGGGPGPVPEAAAHPMGNVSISHYAGLEIGPAEIEVKYLLDFAEIPSVRELDRIDPDRDDLVTPEERAAYLEERSAELIPNLRLEVNGLPLPLETVWSHVTFPPGEGGLSTVRIVWELRAEHAPPANAPKSFLVWNDSNFPDNDGWKEIRISGVGGVGIGKTSLKYAVTSAELSEYPEEYLFNPPRDTKAWCHFGLGLAPPPEAAEGEASVPTDGAESEGDGVPAGFGERAEDPFVSLLRTDGSGPRVLIVSLLLALVLGAGHALEPGHGKTVVAAYLVGSRGTLQQAVLLGLVVTITHTFSVFLLGMGVLVLSRYVLPETLFPWLGVLSGALIVAVGLYMLRARLRERRAARDHAHPHAHAHDHDRAHDHGHAHGHGHSHTHVPTDKATLGSILALGVSGGLVPCPAGIVVLLAAVALGRIAFGLALIVAFSIGLAAVLIGIGALFVTARRLFDRAPLGGRLASGLGVASATVVTLFGIALTIRSILELPGTAG